MTAETEDLLDDVDADLALYAKLQDALTPGYAAEFDPDEAQSAGAFAEDALSETDALESVLDLDAALALAAPDTEA